MLNWWSTSLEDWHYCFNGISYIGDKTAPAACIKHNDGRIKDADGQIDVDNFVKCDDDCIDGIEAHYADDDSYT